MKKKIPIILPILFTCLFIQSCGIFGSDEGLDYATYEGIFVSTTEESSLNPCSEDARWWVDPGDTDLNERYQELMEGTQAVIFVRLEGDPGPEGEYDHGPAGTFDREFTVEEVLEVRYATEDDCN